MSKKQPRPRVERVTLCESCGEPHSCLTSERDAPTVHRCPRCNPRRAQGPPSPAPDPLEELLDLREQEWDK